MSSTLRLSTHSEADGDPEQTDSTEQRMRRALGLLPSGEKPVRPQPASPGLARNNRNAGQGATGQGVNRVAVAETALAAERQARERAEKQLSESEATILKLTTKLGQIELARDEALTALAAERQRREQAEAQVARPAAEVAKPAEEPAPDAKKRGRKPAIRAEAPPQDDDEPVEWWVPGWRSR